MPNFFELLNQEVTFNIDLSKLETHFIEAQKQAHPDNSQNTPEAAYKSAEINQAYMVLKDPFKRASYILSLKDISADDTPVSAAFLMQQMDIRERLESAGQLSEKESILAEIQAEIQSGFAQLKMLLHPNQAADALRQAASLLKELKFWLSLESASILS